MNWAFARDNGLPFSRYLYRVNESTRTPVVSVWASVLCAALLGLISFAGEDAISAIFTLGVVAQYVGNLIPIAARHLGGVEFKPGIPPRYSTCTSNPLAVDLRAYSRPEWLWWWSLVQSLQGLRKGPIMDPSQRSRTPQPKVFRGQCGLLTQTQRQQQN